MCFTTESWSQWLEKTKLFFPQQTTHYIEIKKMNLFGKAHHKYAIEVPNKSSWVKWILEMRFCDDESV